MKEANDGRGNTHAKLSILTMASNVHDTSLKGSQQMDLMSRFW